MTSKWESTVERYPVDAAGERLNVFDIVKILQIPDYYFLGESDERYISAIRGYQGCYAIIKYSMWPDKDGVTRWYGENDMLIVEATKAKDDNITAFQFTIPPAMLRKVPFNLLLMNLFVDYDWQVQYSYAKHSLEDGEQDWSLGPQLVTEFPVKAGTKQHRVLSIISRMPYEKLVFIQNEIEKMVPELGER